MESKLNRRSFVKACGVVVGTGVVASMSGLRFWERKERGKDTIRVGLAFESNPGGGVDTQVFDRRIPCGYSVLHLLATTDGIETVTLKRLKGGLLVVHLINEKENTSEEAWQFSVNEGIPGEGLDRQLEDGDLVSWRYVLIQFKEERET